MNLSGAIMSESSFSAAEVSWSSYITLNVSPPVENVIQVGPKMSTTEVF